MLVKKLRGRSRKWQLLQKLAFGLFLLLSFWLVFNTITLIYASSKVIDANFVLGGSIQREIYAADLARKNPEIPTLISQGSQDPCIFLIFQKKRVNVEKIWLEKCADSTFGNFFYSLPILNKWKVRKVRLITSSSHLPRAKWMAQIILGANGIWVELDIAKEKGVPGNRESWIKTGMDVTRSIFWSGLSHFIQPHCSNVIQLVDVDIKAWQQKGFNCERQGRKLIRNSS
jgi:uncharacterized SAM-binding protein YcdF (DUF218 family)